MKHLDFETLKEFTREEDEEGNPIPHCHSCGYPLEKDEEILCTVCQEIERSRWN